MSRDMSLIVIAFLLVVFPWMLVNLRFKLRAIPSCSLLFGLFLVSLFCVAVADHLMAFHDWYSWSGYAGATKLGQ